MIDQKVNGGAVICIPIKLQSILNSKTNWWNLFKRKKLYQNAIKPFLNLNTMQIHNIKRPLKLKLTRIAPRQFDVDNLYASFKPVIDIIADFLHPGLAPGQADKNLEIEVSQEKGAPKQYFIKIEIDTKCKADLQTQSEDA